MCPRARSRESVARDTRVVRNSINARLTFGLKIGVGERGRKGVGKVPRRNYYFFMSIELILPVIVITLI